MYLPPKERSFRTGQTKRFCWAVKKNMGEKKRVGSLWSKGFMDLSIAGIDPPAFI